MTASEVKRKIIEVVQTEYKNGMVNMFEGNVSARFEDRFFITPSQVEKMSMEEDMIIEIDKDGNILYAKEGYKPSSELFMHLEVYKLRPDVNAVVHNHSLYATAFAVNNMPLVTDALTEANISFGPIPVVPYGTPGTDKIYKDFDKYLIDNWAVLLANHGVLTYGFDLTLAYSYAEAVEKIAKTVYTAKQLGQPSNINKEEVEALRAFGLNARKAMISKAINK